MSFPIQQIVARKVRTARLRLGLSQDELAHRSGLHRTYVGGVERGERNISLKSLQRLADALEEAPDKLISSDGDHD